MRNHGNSKRKKSEAPQSTNHMLLCANPTPFQPAQHIPTAWEGRCGEPTAGKLSHREKEQGPTQGCREWRSSFPHCSTSLSLIPAVAGVPATPAPSETCPSQHLFVSRFHLQNHGHLLLARDGGMGTTTLPLPSAYWKKKLGNNNYR